MAGGMHKAKLMLYVQADVCRALFGRERRVRT